MAKAPPPRPTLQERTAGVLLHVTSLPTAFGVGDTGPSARSFIDFLKASGQRWWQMLPLGPSGLGNSPYQAFSAFAGNPLLISPEDLCKDDLLTQQEIVSAEVAPTDTVNFTQAIRLKYRLLGLAFARFLEKRTRGFDAFEAENASWLNDYALFTVLQHIQKGTPWMEWQASLRLRDPNALKEASRNLEEKILFQKFAQFQFYRQWKKLKVYAASQGIGLIGDLPIFISQDSADVWSHPEIFRLGANGRPTVVAGVPPDAFSKTGQRWGNPLYDWDTLQETHYDWWIQRFNSVFEQFDVIRLDHFIGFHRFWEIPANESVATKGRYVPGPGAPFFKEVFKQLPKASFIAEDLGVLIPEVTALRKEFNVPGMSIVQFAFGGDPEKNPYLPDKLEKETVVYTGTHDNNTAMGWYDSDATPEELKALKTYLSPEPGPIHQELTRMAYASAANTAIIPMQDILGLGAEARMNFPGKLEGNWKWRMKPGALKPEVSSYLSKLAEANNRKKRPA